MIRGRSGSSRNAMEQRIGDRRALEGGDSEACFRSIIGLSSDWYWELDAEGRFTELSGRGMERVGIRRAAVLGRPHWDLPGMQLDAVQLEAVGAAIAEQRPFRNLGLSITLAGGRVRNVEISGQPKFDSSGVFAGYRGVGRDVTRHLDKAAELHATLRFARKTLDALTKHICVIDQDGIIVAVNRAWRQFALENHGAQHRVMERSNYLATCDAVRGADAGDAATFADGARAVLAGRQKEFRMEYPCHSPDAQRWFQVRVTRFDDDGPVRAVVAHENITERKRREEDLQRFRVALDSAVEGIYLIDPGTLQFIDINHTACLMLGYSRDEMLAMRPGETAGLSAEEMRQQLQDILASGKVRTLDQLHRRKDGSLIPTETIRRPVRSQNGWIVVTTVRDITLRKQAEELAARQARQQGAIAAFGYRALAIINQEQLCREATRVVREGLDVEFTRLMQWMPDGHSLKVRAGNGWAPAWAGWCTPEADQPVKHAHLKTEERVIVDDFGTETRFPPSDMLIAHGIASAVEVVIAGGSMRFGTLGAFSRQRHRFSPADAAFLQSVANIVGTAVERQQGEEKMAYMAQFDSLTGLPNRSLLRDRLSHALKQVQHNRRQVGVLIVDLDQFKVVNDTLGHSVGDTLLVQAAGRLQECVRAGDTVARLGGDEFAVVLSSLARPDDAGPVAQKIMDAFGREFGIQNQQVHVTASIGVALHPGDGTDAGTLLRHAEVALHRAKEQGRDNCQFYLPQMNERAVQRMQTDAQLRGALERGEFLLHYQPKADLYTGMICGFEALLRWRHPSRGLVAPGEFISVLEDTGLIVPVGEWAIRTACLQIRNWQEQGLKALPVAVNLSARQFRQKNLEAVIERILKETGIDPRLLELELTESLLMNDAEAAARTLRNLKSFGVRLAVDDFGTGYSSLAYLKRFPLDALKIDRAFIRDCIANPEDAMIASAVISLAHSLKLKVIAEGVESEAQLNFLRSRGCDQIQGYYFARPLDASVATGALAENMHLQGSIYAGAAHAASLLLVDDNADDLELSRLNLAPDGYRILTAKSPQAAFDALASHKVDVVISDQNMPGMSGADFLGAVRKLYPGVIRIMLSASDDPEMLPKAINEAGIHTFLSKHWDAERLRLTVREACRALR